MESFDKVLEDKKPSVWMLQETKQKIHDAKMSATNLINYQVFELRREKSILEGGKGVGGGGLAIGVLHDLDPVLLRQGNDEVECLTVEITTGYTRLRCVVGYGPQMSDTSSRKEKFWKYLENEVGSASEDGVGLVIEVDSNAWAGKSLIPSDPNTQNSNGKLLQAFLEQNKNITLVNSLDLCKGSFTRKRNTACVNEKSILDLFLVCDKVLPLVSSMHVDEKGEHQLANFYGKNHNGKVTHTDHAQVELQINLKFEVHKPLRIEVFNFKNLECQKYFKELTTNTEKLSSCFKSDEPFQKQVKKWEHEIKSHVVQSFPKIRSRKRKFSESEIGHLLEERKKEITAK